MKKNKPISEREAYKLARDTVGWKQHTEPKKTCKTCKEVDTMAQELLKLK